MNSNAGKDARMKPQTPALSIVIASVNGLDLLEKTLKAIDNLAERPQIEVVVVDRVGQSVRSRLKDRSPKITVVPVDQKLTIPRLRFLGVGASKAPIVAFLEDHVAVEPGWAAAILEAHRNDCGAVGGAVADGRTDLVSTAAFLCEYHRYMPPVVEGPCDDLPGNNIAYKREVIEKYAYLLDNGKWESWINQELKAEGALTRSTGRAVVRHIKPFGFMHFLTQRFHFARSFAGMRRDDQSWTRRIVYGLGSIALPLLFLLRIFRAVIVKRVAPGRFLKALPLIVVFVSAGAIGEMIGYIVGSGTSLERVE